ncbi:MAG: Ig-like domain-containing protein [Verrucomicrobiota bacterium]
MPVIGNLQYCHLRALLPLGLAVLCLVMPGVSKADGTNGTRPVVSVQTTGNATMSGSLSGAFTIQRTGDTSQALVVNYRLSGTATNGIDYQRLSGAVTIPAGQSAASVGVIPMSNPAEGIDKNVTLTLVSQNQPFTIVALPDSQNYTREINGGLRDIFTAQTQWIAAHKYDSNVVFVLHEGDITDGNSASEWTNAMASIGLLDGVVPYALAVGNHDGLMSSQSLTAPFNQFFPVSRYQNLPTFGGVFESNRMDNCYHFFSAGGVDWLVFSLEFGPRNEVLAWANQVATNYPNRRVIVLTHTHIYSDNTLHGSSPNHLWTPTSYGRENNGTDVWEKFIRHHANMALTFNGHVLNSGTGRLVGVGDYGNQVFQMLANFQEAKLGGSGFFRIVQFFPDQDMMSVKTYSPLLDSWLTDTNNQFTYTNLGIFTNTGPGYLLDTQNTSAGLIITNDNVDLTPPGVCGFSYAGVPPVFKVTFNEPVETVSAQTVANYSIDSAVHLTGATLLSDGRTVALTTDSGLAPNALYTLTVNHVKDCARAANAMVVPVTSTFTYSPVFLCDGLTNSLLQGWTVVDEGTIEAPSRWLEGSGRLMQFSNIYGPNGNAADHRKGTFIYWNDPAALSWSNYTFSVTFNNPDQDGVGVMFCYQNPSNYYKVDLDSQRNFHKLFKMAGGVETTLAAESGAYVVASNHVLRVEMTNNQIAVLLNGTILFGGTITDSNNLASGTVALYSWGSEGVFFNNLQVIPLQCTPRVSISSPINGSAISQPGPASITVDAFDLDGVVRTVSLFSGATLLATLTNAPYQFPWTNSALGSYTLTAQAVDDSGLIGVSSPVGFVIVPPPPKPTFIVQPASQNVSTGNAAMFSAQAVGPQPIYYQWLCNGVPIDGATNMFLILNNIQPANAGTNTVLASNQWGSVVSQPAILSVNSTAPPASNANFPPSMCLASAGIPDSGVPLISVNVTNVTIVTIYWSSNLFVWTPLLTLTNGGNILYFDDPDAAGQPCRFYRAVAQ